jgi:hypothetical protein
MGKNKQRQNRRSKHSPSSKSSTASGSPDSQHSPSSIASDSKTSNQPGIVNANNSPPQDIQTYADAASTPPASTQGTQVQTSDLSRGTQPPTVPQAIPKNPPVHPKTSPVHPKTSTMPDAPTGSTVTFDVPTERKDRAMARNMVRGDHIDSSLSSIVPTPSTINNTVADITNLPIASDDNNVNDDVTIDDNSSLETNESINNNNNAEIPTNTTGNSTELLTPAVPDNSTDSHLPNQDTPLRTGNSRS